MNGVKRFLVLCCTLALILSLIPNFSVALDDTEAPSNEISQTCSYSLPSSGLEAARLYDENILSRITVREGKCISIVFPRDGAGYLYIEWYELPKTYRLIQYGDGVELSRSVLSPAVFTELVPLAEGCDSVELYSVSGYTVSTLRLFSSMPNVTLPLMTEASLCDLLLYLAEPTSLFEQFSALVPLYSGEHGVTTAVALGGYEHRYQEAEAELALHSLGFTVAPIQLGFGFDATASYEQAVKKLYTANSLEALTRLIRRLKPKLIVTHSSDSAVAYERVSAELLLAAVNAAADPMQYTDSAAWHVSKVYCLDSQGACELDFTKNASRFFGLTPLETAQQAYRRCASRQLFHYELSESIRLSLAISTVGNDVKGGDILENLALSELAVYLTPIPTATPTPEPTPSAEPTIEPTVEPVATVLPSATQWEEAGLAPSSASPAPAPTASGFILPWWSFAAIGFALGALLLIVLRKRASTIAVILLMLLPLVAGAAVSLYSYMSISEPVSEAVVPSPTPTVAPTLSPSAAPSSVPAPGLTPQPTATPSFTPSPAPTATPFMASEVGAKFEERFLEFGSAELVEADEAAGRWVYRSDILTVEIERHNTMVSYQGRSYPQVNFIAHIYMRGYDSFRPAFGSDKQNGTDICVPTDMAMRYKPVLLITGDNLINADTEKKGVLIRDGRIYSRKQNMEQLVLLPAELALDIVDKGSVPADDLLERGIENSFSFGPTLIKGGVISSRLDHIGTGPNPRCGLGMVEPGHFVAVISDGRQDGYSYGLSLAQFAELFAAEGCVMAFNLDGGVSTCIMFMGVQLNRHSGDKEDLSWQRLLPDALMWGYSENVYIDSTAGAAQEG